MKSQAVICRNLQDYQIKNFTIPPLEDSWLLIEINYAPFTETDLFFIRNNKSGNYFIPGSEAFGVVKEVGLEASKVYHVKKGDMVYIEPSILCKECKSCLTGNYSLCEHRNRYGTISSDTYPYLLGSFSQHLIVLPGSRVHKIEPGISLQCLTWSSYLSKALRCISTIGQGSVGMDLLILGWNRLSFSCDLVAKSIGYDKVHVFVNIPSPEKMKFAKSYGINLITDFEHNQYDQVIDTLGSPASFKEAITMLKPMSKYLLVSGYISDDLILPVNHVTQREINVIGVFEPSWEMNQAIRYLKSQSLTKLEKLPNLEYPIRAFHKALKEVQGGSITNVIIKP